jgi:hypothetical protein
MAENKDSSRSSRAYPWLLVLSLVGLDYFSTLAYLPSIAVAEAGPLAPIAALGVSLVTLLAALPVYLYVVGRSPQGEGATGLLERRVHGWFGKFLILMLLGFVAADFVITRTLSLADASLHILHNPYWQDHVHSFQQNKEAVRASLPAVLQGRFFDFWTEQLVLTVVLSLVGFGFYAFLQTGLSHAFLRFAAAVVGLYLLLSVFVVGSGVFLLVSQPELVKSWWSDVGRVTGAGHGTTPLASSWGLLFVGLYFFPKVALGVSGFELSMAVAPLIQARPGDDPARPRGRIRDARKLIFLSALVMAILVPAATLIVTLLVPVDALKGGSAAHRALAYLAHGEGADKSEVPSLGWIFGPVFGTVYDASTALILVFAGASAILGIRNLVPGFLARFGMQLEWARKVGVMTHLFNTTILLVTVWFQASVSAQQGAYASSVLVLLTSAAVAALLDVRARLHGSWLGPVASAPFLVLTLFFLYMAGLNVLHNPYGLAIAMIFVAITLSTSLASRYLRNRELRFHGFAFADDGSRRRWEEIRNLEFQVLVPHRTGQTTLLQKEDEVRHKHRLAPDVPIIFIEVELGDASEFYHEPMMRIDHEEGREVIRLSRVASVSHVLAAIGLEFTKVGRPPEIIFGWSSEGPVAAMLHFLFLGQGNVPWMVHELIRHAEPNPARRPRVTIG